MTGGYPHAAVLNAALASAAERWGLAMGLGSQRAALVSPELAHTYIAARRAGPTATLYANVGLPQLVSQTDGAPAAVGLDEARRLVEMVDAQALIVHLNWLQEVVQPEGDRRARGTLAALEHLCTRIGVPVIAKETGAGLDVEDARRLEEVGVAALDVGGAGGTSFARVEGMRAEEAGDDVHARLGAALADWGIPTPVSVARCAAVGLPLVATGGVRTGLDAARALALGAHVVGVARPLVEAALTPDPDAALDGWLRGFTEQLAAVAFLCAAHGVEDLRKARYALVGESAQWLRDLRARYGDR